MTSLAFFGNEQLSTTKGYAGTPILDSLLKRGYQIEGILLPATGTPIRNEAHQPTIQKAAQHDIPVIPVENAVRLSELVKELNSDIAVLASFGMIIPSSIIDHFGRGIINVHPSPLPIYRGPTPIEAAILNGDRVTGVTLMKIAPEMDAGDIYQTAKIRLNGQETKLELTSKLARMGADLLIKTLPKILDGYKPREQDAEKATYTQLVTKKDANLDFSKSADRLMREIRAYRDWPGSRTTIFEQSVTITDAYAVKQHAYGPGESGSYRISNHNKQIILKCEKGWLCVKRLKPANRREMSVVDFINGLAKR